MLKYAITIVVAAIVAATGNVGMSMADGGPGTKISGVDSEKSLLDKNWTTRVQEKEVGSQMLMLFALTNPFSFQADGKGFYAEVGWSVTVTWASTTSEGQKTVSSSP